MKKAIVISLLVIIGLTMVLGCDRGETRYYGSGQSAAPQQQGGQQGYPVGAGCGVAEGPEVGLPLSVEAIAA